MIWRHRGNRPQKVAGRLLISDTLNRQWPSVLEAAGFDLTNRLLEFDRAEDDPVFVLRRSACIVEDDAFASVACGWSSAERSCELSVLTEATTPNLHLALRIQAALVEAGAVVVDDSISEGLAELEQASD
ncbi:MAG: hypothetical protein Kow00105_20400 [Phycisphaeraceae bacterium]